MMDNSEPIEPVTQAAHYYVSGIVVTSASPAYFQIMEEAGKEQVCIATVPFNKHINPKKGRESAMRDARMIVDALNTASRTTPAPRQHSELALRNQLAKALGDLPFDADGSRNSDAAVTTCMAVISPHIAALRTPANTVSPADVDGLVSLIRKVRECRSRIKGKSVHGEKYDKEAWSITHLNKLLPELDAALAPFTKAKT
jgi:hypothetical protein